MSTFYRTYSSPNLKSKGKNLSSQELQEDKYAYETEDEEFYVIGDRVYVDGKKPASVAYFGEVDFANGDWVGVVFDEPLGYHDGKIHGREYFQCSPFHGSFVRPHRLTRIRDSALGSSAASSRISTPLPNFNLHRPTSYGRVSRSPGSSVTGSYYYDEDYRQDNKPTVSSLTRKLNSINGSTGSGLNLDRPNGGILKRISRSQSTDPTFISARTEELSNRIRAQSASRSPVFNFRPKREQLNDYGSSRSSVDLSTEPPDIGDKVVVRTERGEMVGILRFLGETNFATGDWAGIELDYPDGKNDGSVLGFRYFHCPKQYGLFVPAVRVKKYRPTSSLLAESPKPEFNSIRNTIRSPPPRTRPTYDPYNSRSSSVASSPYTSPSSRLSTPVSYYTNSRFNYDTSLPAKSYGRTSSPLSLSYIDELSSKNRLFERSRPKFDETDIDIELKKSLAEPPTSRRVTKILNSNHEEAKPKAVRYTFSSSKYDGSPIARRTLIYE